MLVCELNRLRSEGKELSETEKIIADAFGNGEEMDVAKLSLAFDIAALLGKAVKFIWEPTEFLYICPRWEVTGVS